MESILNSLEETDIMGRIRRRFDASFKARVSLEALKNEKTISQLSSEYGVHPNQIQQWKKHLLAELPGIFSRNGNQSKEDKEALTDELYKHIGQLKVELDWLKKNLSSSVEEKIKSVESKHPMISIRRQCDLLSLCRSTYYYKSMKDDSYNIHLMNLIDEEYTRHPFYGVRRMKVMLEGKGHRVNHKRIRRLSRKMGIEAIYPKPKLTKPSSEHKKYPYLLKGLSIEHPNHVWCSDITYIKTKYGFVYLTAIMDWFSRYVLSFEVSTTLDKEFCISALKRALTCSKPEIFNSDQGVQFTCEEFINCLKEAEVKISMDGRGRAHDNIFIERL